MVDKKNWLQLLAYVMNDAALRDSERAAILKARLALRMFEQAMESLKAISDEAPSAAEHGFRMAA